MCLIDETGEYGIIAAERLLYLIELMYHNAALRLWYNNRRAAIIFDRIDIPQRRFTAVV